MHYFSAFYTLQMQMFPAIPLFSCILINCFIRIYIRILYNNIFRTELIKKTIYGRCIYTDFFFLKVPFYICCTYCRGTVFFKIIKNFWSVFRCVRFSLFHNIYILPFLFLQWYLYRLESWFHLYFTHVFLFSQCSPEEFKMN